MVSPYFVIRTVHAINTCVFLCDPPTTCQLTPMLPASLDFKFPGLRLRSGRANGFARAGSAEPASSSRYMDPREPHGTSAAAAPSSATLFGGRTDVTVEATPLRARAPPICRHA